MAGTRQTSRRTPDEKKTSVKDNWCKVFTEQNYPIIKQGVQRLAGQLQSSRNSRHGTPQRPETKNSTTSRKLPKKQVSFLSWSKCRVTMIFFTTIVVSNSFLFFII